MVVRSHPHVPDSNYLGISPAGTRSQSLKSTVKEGYTSIRVSHQLISFQKNTIDSIRLVLLDVYGLMVIRRTIHIIHNSTCHRKVRYLSGANHPQWHAVARRPQSTYREPYVQKTPIPTTMAHANNRYRPIATHIYNACS